jgi:ubiquinone/menaquinone biosynthesis C-methylase UbiE
VLAAGSGLGQNTRTLARSVSPGGRAVGVDLSGHLVARARDRSAHESVEYHIADLTALPFAAASFDAVYT